MDENGDAFPVVEPNVSEADLALARDADLAKGLGLNAFKGWGVAGSPAFVADFVRFRTQIGTDGARKTLDDLLKATAD